MRAGLVVHDPRFAHQWLFIKTDDQENPKELTLVLQPATMIEGCVLADDTGLPIPNATIAVAASRDELDAMYTTRFRADKNGRFVANPSPGSYFRLSAAAPDGQPYLVLPARFTASAICPIETNTASWSARILPSKRARQSISVRF
jgi:hypothetical protein